MAGGGATAAARLAHTILCWLDESPVDDPMRTCPLSEIKRMNEHPELVLQRTADEINAEMVPEDQVCWLRLHEDATLSMAAKMLNLRAKNDSGATVDWLGDVIWILDTGLTKSTGITRRKVFDYVFAELENMADGDPSEITDCFNITEPQPLSTPFPIYHPGRYITYEEFNEYIHEHGTPIILPDITTYWPASQRWQDPGYWLRITLGGRRIIPVEIGESYTSSDYRSELMSFRKYLTRYVLPSNPHEMGYLAQHELFDQIPALEDDILIPDYVYTTPPPPLPSSAAAHTPGLDEVIGLPLPYPLKNIWLGPKGTKTTLHTDPYHNILAQVVGYKYVRLYSPEQREFLYPCDVDETTGKDISNTSRVDISCMLPIATGGTLCPGGCGPKYGPNLEDMPGTDLDRLRISFSKTWPLAIQAQYQECILKPGECLYIPLGWWHYIESLSVSVSVNFWWN